MAPVALTCWAATNVALKILSVWMVFHSAKTHFDRSPPLNCVTRSPPPYVFDDGPHKALRSEFVAMRPLPHFATDNEVLSGEPVTQLFDVPNAKTWKSKSIDVRRSVRKNESSQQAMSSWPEKLGIWQLQFPQIPLNLSNAPSVGNVLSVSWQVAREHKAQHRWLLPVPML